MSPVPSGQTALRTIRRQDHRASLGIHQWLWVLCVPPDPAWVSHAQESPASYLPEVQQANAIYACQNRRA